jgi:predicted ATP-dependent serine protease
MTVNKPLKIIATKNDQATTDKPNLNEILGSDIWLCTACYAQNKKDMTKCVRCSTIKKMTTVTQVFKSTLNEPKKDDATSKSSTCQIEKGKFKSQ